MNELERAKRIVKQVQKLADVRAHDSGLGSRTGTIHVGELDKILAETHRVIDGRLEPVETLVPGVILTFTAGDITVGVN